MIPQIIGDDLLARDEQGRLRTRIATCFPRQNVIVTLPGIHATQRFAFTERLCGQCVSANRPILSETEQEDIWLNAVDLIVDDDAVEIRPDPQNMELAFEADEMLQKIISKKKVKFLHLLDSRVRDAIRRRGELWRISPLPRSPEQMTQMIASSRIAIGGRALYYYNKTSGTRLLTYQDFSTLGTASDDELRHHLQEIKDYSLHRNRLGRPEIAFFATEDPTFTSAFAAYDFAAITGPQLRIVYDGLRRKFYEAVKPEFRLDDLQNPLWRGQMYAALIGQTEKAVSEEALLGLSAEFFMQVEWLPGGRIDAGELILDSVIEEEESARIPPSQRVSDPKTRAFIFNLIRDYVELDYVNIGRVTGSMSSRQSSLGRRGVYLAEVQPKGPPNTKPILRIIRMQKWGTREHLDEGKDLLSAMLEAEEYTEYVLDRRLGCRQLGMNVAPRLVSRKNGEHYDGCNGQYWGRWIWSPYFERDYIAGLASDKIPSTRLADEPFATGLARVLGRAAAPNLIVGRCDLKYQPIFDDGDELVLEDARGVPTHVVVADHTGTFVDYRRDLRELVPAYANVINKRVPHIPDPQVFATAFLDEFIWRFSQIQQEYQRRKRAFDTLFVHERRDEGGSFAYRWERVLARLAAADPFELAELIRQNIPTLSEVGAAR